jgi:calcineurin-like phosphoesterase family protein
LRTLVVSDLHLGGRGGRQLLHRPEYVATLRSALANLDCLVLLGDIVEFRELPIRDAFATASPILKELVSGLPKGAEVVVVPGNHDHFLGGGWSLRRSLQPPAKIGLSEQLDWRDGEPLAALMKVLGSSKAHVSAYYPGVFVREDIYAHHGHYLDRHTIVPAFERLGAGAMGKLLHTPAAQTRSVDDYENVLTPIYAWMYAMAQAGEVGDSVQNGASSRIWRAIREGSGWRKYSAQAGVGALVGVLNRAGLGPVSASVLRDGIDGTELPAFAAVLEALEVPASWALFGHTHRAGPLRADDPKRWTSPSGVKMVNTGSWVYDDTFITPEATDSSPYRPGFAVRIQDNDPPELVNLLGGEG